MVSKVTRKKVTLTFTSVFFTLAIALLALSPMPLHAQWNSIASGVTAAEAQHIGALRFRGGVAWAGTTSITYSSDTGVTWNAVPSFPTLRNGTGISDIAIYDAQHVLVSTIGTGASNGEGLFLTTDGGKTWKNIQPPGSDGNFVQVAFDASAQVMHALEYGASILFTSLDGGVTWRGTTTTLTGSNGSLCFAIAADKTIYVESYSGNQGWINSSKDLGQTWSGDSRLTDGDCNTLAADSCDVSRLYLIDENVAENLQLPRPQSHLDVTPTAGTTWQTPSAYTFNYYNGSLASTASVLYVGTVPGAGKGIGVQRSTDSGLTWLNIGGPTEEYDTRSIAAVNDSILLVLDQNGSVWRTLNSGGKPLPPPFSVSPATLFQTDTISCTNITRSVVFSRRGCTAPSVSSVAIGGPDSQSYTLGTLHPDSLSVTFSGVIPGEQNAALIVTLDDGTTDTVSLAGYANITPSIIALTTQNVQTDTLGATVSIPITFTGLEQPETIELALHYEGTIDYLGSFSPTGTKLDVPGQQSAGRSLLQIVGAVSGAIAGYAKFNVFNDTDGAENASFDSINVLTATRQCEYELPAPVTSIITPPSGCGIPILSKLIHLGQSPAFGVYPNPAEGMVWITSTENMEDATIAVYDMLGTERSEMLTTVQKNNPLQITLPDADGVYTIVVTSSTGMNSLRVIRRQ